MRSLSFDLGGYMESEIVYNTTHKKWEIHVLNGGFHAGGGVSYSLAVQYGGGRGAPWSFL